MFRAMFFHAAPTLLGKIEISNEDLVDKINYTNKVLALENYRITISQYELLVQLLNRKPNIKALELRNCSISAEVCKQIAKSENLQRLLIISKQDENGKAAALATNLHFKEIDLEFPTISITTAKVLAQNRTLNSLRLSTNTGEMDSCLEFAKAIAENCTLRKLELQGLGISDEDAKILALNKTLIELSLPLNNIGDAGAQALAQNNRIIKLNLNLNDVSLQGLMTLENNTKLQSLSLMGSFPNEYEEPIKEQIALNLKTARELEAAFIFKVLNIALSHDHTNQNESFWKIPWDIILIILEQAADPLGYAPEQTRRMANLVKDNVTLWDRKKPVWKTVAENGVTLFKITPRCEKVFNGYMERKSLHPK